jgi:hypothetical protein
MRAGSEKAKGGGDDADREVEKGQRKACRRMQAGWTANR